MTKGRFANIDALRAIAALAVVVQHFMGDVLREGPATTTPLVQAFSLSINSFDLGRFGVVLFFLISGFVVPFSIRGSQPLRRFAISRFFRLYPALWLAVLILAAWFWLLGASVSPATVFANLTMIPSILGHPWISGAYWTLTIEIIFYALSALLFWAGLLYNPRAVTALAISLILATAIPVYAHMASIRLPIQYITLHLACLYCGLLLRMAMIDKAEGASFGAFVVILLLALVLLTIGDVSLQRNDSFFLVGKLPILTAYAAALALFLLSIWYGRPQSQSLSQLGNISYSIYLFHGIAATIVYQAMPLTGTVADLGAGLAALSLTLVLSWAVYSAVEKPMIRLGHRLAA